jgi:hypothetical protein
MAIKLSKEPLRPVKNKKDAVLLDALLEDKTGVVIVCATPARNGDKTMCDIQLAQRSGAAALGELGAAVGIKGGVQFAWMNSRKIDDITAEIGDEFPEQSIQVTEHTNMRVVQKKDGSFTVPKPRQRKEDDETVVVLHEGDPIFRDVQIVTGAPKNTYLTPDEKTIPLDEYNAIASDAINAHENKLAREAQ